MFSLPYTATYTYKYYIGIWEIHQKINISEENILSPRSHQLCCCIENRAHTFLVAYYSACSLVKWNAHTSYQFIFLGAFLLHFEPFTFPRIYNKLELYGS